MWTSNPQTYKAARTECTMTHNKSVGLVLAEIGHVELNKEPDIPFTYRPRKWHTMMKGDPGITEVRRTIRCNSPEAGVHATLLHCARWGCDNYTINTEIPGHG